MAVSGHHQRKRRERRTPNGRVPLRQSAAGPVREPADLPHIGGDVALALEARGGHVSDRAEDRAFLPGSVVQTEQPSHARERVGVAAV